MGEGKEQLSKNEGSPRLENDWSMPASDPKIVAFTKTLAEKGGITFSDDDKDYAPKALYLICKRYSEDGSKPMDVQEITKKRNDEGVVIGQQLPKLLGGHVGEGKRVLNERPRGNYQLIPIPEVLTIYNECVAQENTQAGAPSTDSSSTM